LFYNVRLSAAYPLQIFALWNGGIGYGSVLGCTGFCLIPRCIALRGYVDLVSRDCVAGSAQSVEHPEAPICLDIYAGGELIGRTLANRYREDLERAGICSGCHSFSFAPPDGLLALSHAPKLE
jgi:hypothetical protein